MMTREDMMRELELLPVWQLRSPLPTTQVPSQVQEVIAEKVKVSETAFKAEAIVDIVIESDLGADATELDVTVESASTTQELTFISSDDGDWLFVLSSVVLTNEEQQLFQNICKAMRLKTKRAETSTNALMLIDSLHPKLLLVLGEDIAQTLLLSTEPIDTLRGSKYQLQDATLIVTYDLAHLLKNHADKAKAWNDICMGLQVLQDLKVANN